MKTVLYVSKKQEKPVLCVNLTLAYAFSPFQDLGQWAGRWKKRARDKRGLGLTKSLEQTIMVYYALPGAHH